MRVFRKEEEAAILSTLVARYEECSGRVHDGLRALMTDAAKERPCDIERIEDSGADLTVFVTGQRRDECRALRHSIDRIRVGLLGICEDCERDIPKRRIRKNNEAVTCIRCQEARELGGERSSEDPFPQYSKHRKDAPATA